MNKYITSFTTTEEFNTSKSSLKKPHVSLTKDDMKVHYIPYDYSDRYLTFIALEDGTFQFFGGNSINYSIDGGTTWTELAVFTNTPTITSGNKIIWKATLTPHTSSSSGIGTFSSTCNFNVEGNPMSLLYGDNFVGQTDLTGKNYAFCNLFRDCSKLINAENLSLSATILANYCYQYMFSGCTSLITLPELPATTLANNCYENMFSSCTSLTTAPKLPATTLASGCSGCTSLTSAPELPATTLAMGCYSSMFVSCTDLITAPKLPATTLASGCYTNMFSDCISLTTAPELPATTLVNDCYGFMFDGCSHLNYIKAMFTTTPSSTYTDYWVYRVAATGTFVKNPNATWNVTGNNGVPNGWTIEYDYSSQYLTFVALQDGTFQFSNSINYSIDNGATWTQLAANTATPTITSGNKIIWKATLIPSSKNGIGTFSSTGDFNVEGNAMSLLYGDNFIEQTDLTSKDYTFFVLFNDCQVINAEHLSLPATTLASSCYGNMFYRCSSLTTAPELPATTLTEYCYAGMFEGCISLTTAPELHATILANYCYDSMFRNCSNLTTAPTLSATTLANYCYIYMFYGCTSLNYIKAMFTTTPSSTYTGSWVNGVAASGTFVKNSAAEWNVTGVNGIPTGWTVQTASS